MSAPGAAGGAGAVESPAAGGAAPASAAPSNAAPQAPDLCIVGAGSAGLALAAGASQMGASVVLVEDRLMGGDCLNFGCVPSKALLVAAREARHARDAGRFGIDAGGVRVDFARVHAHVRGIIDSIAPHDSEERFRALGCDVVRARGRFLDARTLEAGGRRFRARRFVVATGSSPLVPPIPGLRETPHLTNETVFDLKELPRSLIVLGGGPIGCELGQAFARLGAKTTIVEMAKALPRDDADAAAVVRASLARDGVDLREGRRAVSVERAGGGVRVSLEVEGGAGESVEADALLVALGRVPNLKDLGLEAAGVETTRAGVKCDAGLRSTNPRVFAAGDAAGGLQFTHVAGWHAGVLVRRLLLRLPAKARSGAVPWVTYTEPELAQVGHTLASARAAGIAAEPAEFAFEENDRARAERETEGFVRAVVDGRGRVVGCTVVGAHAGELILPWVLAVGERKKLSRVAGAIAPYPTLSEASKRAAGAFFTPRIFSPRMRSVVRLLARLP